MERGLYSLLELGPTGRFAGAARGLGLSGVSVERAFWLQLALGTWLDEEELHASVVLASGVTATGRARGLHRSSGAYAVLERKHDVAWRNTLEAQDQKGQVCHLPTSIITRRDSSDSHCGYQRYYYSHRRYNREGDLDHEVFLISCLHSICAKRQTRTGLVPTSFEQPPVTTAYRPTRRNSSSFLPPPHLDLMLHVVPPFIRSTSISRPPPANIQHTHRSPSPCPTTTRTMTTQYAYATRVLAVADSYLQVGGRTPTAL